MTPHAILAAALVVAAAALVAPSATAHAFKLGPISIGHPYARPTAPGQPIGGAYLSLVTAGGPERLVSATTPAAAAVELHSMSMDGNVMRMRELAAIDLVPGQTVTLEPGGVHLMLTGLKAPLKAGQKFPLTLSFERAGSVVVTVNVEADSAAAPAAHDHTKH
ncbi:MAG: copper chaperone PCu(A)C [Burkholderiaceae bacterium]